MTDRTLVFSELDPNTRRARSTLRLIGAVGAGAAIAAVCLMSSPPAMAAAEPAKQCRKYFSAGEYSRAAMDCAAAAHDGDVGSQAALGWMYLHGKGLPKNQPQAAHWIGKAAERGNPAAAALLGGMYLNGEGVPQDREQAAKWIARAAEAGHKGAQVAMGNLAIEPAPADGNALARAQADSAVGSSGGAATAPVEPREVTDAAAAPDPEAAVKWYRKAAKNGSAAGQAALGEAYRLGLGVEQNDVAAYMWYTLAAEQGSAAAADARALVADRMAPDDIRKAEAKARDWREDNADKMARGGDAR
jgi:TPR repeat protein